jgi:hypothetical protein
MLPVQNSSYHYPNLSMSSFNRPSQCQKPRADLKVCSRNNSEIDIETDTSLINYQPDYSAFFGERIGLANRHNAASLHVGQYRFELPWLNR